MLHIRILITDGVIQLAIERVEALITGVSGQLEASKALLNDTSERKWICPECEVPSTSEQWNQETIVKYGEDVFLFDDPAMNESIFVCPHCKRENCGEVITSITIITIKSISEGPIW